MSVAELLGTHVRMSVVVSMAGLTAVLGLCDAADAETHVASQIDAVPATHSLTSAVETAQSAMQALDHIADYQATFVKKEVIGGRLVEQRMRIRFREQPLSVHLNFIEPHNGREVMYIEGRNNNKLLVKETGLASLIGPISLDPASPMAMKETTYPITAIGIRNMLDRLLKHWLSESPDDDLDVAFYPHARIGECACQVVEVTHSRPAPKVDYHKLRLYIEKESGLPIRVQQLGFPAQPGGKPPLVADYAYLGLRTNLGLTDRDFALGQ
jgi:hypothetical protein